MNPAPYQLTFKLVPQSDCRPKGWLSYLIGCSVSDLLTIEINRSRWAYLQATALWGGGRWRLHSYIHTFPQFSPTSLQLLERRKKSLCAVKHVNGEQVRTDKLGITWILSLTHSCYLSYNLSPFSVCFLHSFCILMEERSWQDVMAW